METKYIVRYIFHKETHYDYKMFDRLKNAEDYYLELILEKNIPIDKVKLFTANEVKVKVKVEVI